jgi:hypothetical protein
MPTDALKAREKIPERGTFDLSLFEHLFKPIKSENSTGDQKRACQSIEIQERLRSHLETAR